MFARCVAFSFTAFLLSLFPVAVFSATKEGAVAFDIKTLEGLGYSAELADFFSNKDKFLPGQHDVTIIVNANKTYHIEATFDSEGNLCVDRKLLIALKLRHKDSGDSCEDIEALWPGVAIKLFPGQFRVEMTLPQEAFDPEMEGSDYQSGGHALLLNYNLFGQRIESNGAVFSVNRVLCSKIPFKPLNITCAAVATNRKNISMMAIMFLSNLKMIAKNSTEELYYL